MMQLPQDANLQGQAAHCGWHMPICDYSAIIVVAAICCMHLLALGLCTYVCMTSTVLPACIDSYIGLQHFDQLSS